jgi:hypothetical protein
LLIISLETPMLKYMWMQSCGQRRHSVTLPALRRLKARKRGRASPSLPAPHPPSLPTPHLLVPRRHSRSTPCALNLPFIYLPRSLHPHSPPPAYYPRADTDQMTRTKVLRDFLCPSSLALPSSLPRSPPPLSTQQCPHFSNTNNIVMLFHPSEVQPR